MRRYLFAMTLAAWPAAVATAQFGANPPQPAGGGPRPAAQENFGEQGPAGATTAPPNAMFAVIDADGDGVISKVELRRAIKALKTLDADNDGNITLAEVGGAGGPAALGGNPEVDRMMKELDKNGDGKLTADEVPPEMMPMLQGVDKNRDRALDRDELKAALETNQFRGGRGGAAFPNGRGADPRTGEFLKHDINRDGRLTLEEIPRQMRSAFQPADDLNGDGALDPAELQVFIARMGGGARAVAAGAQPGGDPNTFRDPNRRNRPPAGEEN